MEGAETWYGPPEPFFSVPGATAYGEPVRRNSISERASAARHRLVPRATVRGEVGADVHLTPAPHSLATRRTAVAGLPRTTLRPGPPASRRSVSSACSAANSQARRACPAERSSTGSRTKSGSTASPSSIAARSAGLSASRKSRRTHQIVGPGRLPSSNLAPGRADREATCRGQHDRLATRENDGVSDLIDTTEMYLRTIYEFEEEGIVPLRARIAERLHQSGPTVSQTVARMERDNLVHVRAIGIWS